MPLDQSAVNLTNDDACMPLDQSAVNLTNDDACMPLDQSAVNLTMPVCHWIRALSLLPDCCMFAFGALINAIRSMGSVSAFFLPSSKAKFKGQFKILVQ